MRVAFNRSNLLPLPALLAAVLALAAGMASADAVAAGGETLPKPAAVQPTPSTWGGLTSKDEPARTPAPAPASPPPARTATGSTPPPAPASARGGESARINRPAPTTREAGKAEGAPAATSGAGDVTRVVLALAVVVGLIFFLKWGSHRLFAMPAAHRSTRAVQVLSRSVLTPRQQLVLVQVGRRVLVVADSGAQMNSLSEITDPDEVAALVGQLRSEREAAGSAAIGNAFNGLLGRVRQNFGGGGEDAEDEMPPSPRAERSYLLDRPSPRAGPAAGYDAGGDEEAAMVAARKELEGLRTKLRSVSAQLAQADTASA